MSTGAVVMLIVALAILWGGLTASILFLRRHPQVTEGPAAEDPDDVDPEHDPGDAPLHRDL
jgi:hypothetical protein